MLQGVRENPIVVGAYSDRDGGICPMLAAHRAGERTDFLSFARTWDSFSRAKRSRRATRREVGILVSQIEASLISDDTEAVDLAAAIAEHRAALANRAPSPGMGEELRALEAVQEAIVRVAARPRPAVAGAQR